MRACCWWPGKVLMAEDGKAGFAMAEQIAEDEGRTFIHPFEGPGTVLGTATLGLEFLEQSGPLYALVVAIGGGGLAAGVATAAKLLQPECKVIGVEPEGADTMHRSFEAGAPQTIDKLDTIADSLAPPMALPFSFNLCYRNVDQLVKISDQEMCRAMGLLFREMTLAVEPGGAASTAALVGPLAEQLRGKTVGVILCGSNIDRETFYRQCV